MPAPVVRTLHWHLELGATGAGRSEGISFEVETLFLKLLQSSSEFLPGAQFVWKQRRKRRDSLSDDDDDEDNDEVDDDDRV